MSRERERLTLEGVRFTPEVRAKLEKAGLVTVTLTKQSIDSHRKAGRRFLSSWHSSYPKLELLTSRFSEVAINPRQLFIPGSNNKTLKKQQEMVQAYAEELKKTVKVEEVEVVIGELPDYVDLAFTYSDVTGIRLFGEDYECNYARTKTETSKSIVADIGDFAAAHGLHVGHWGCNSGNDVVFASPLTFPKVV